MENCSSQSSQISLFEFLAFGGEMGASMRAHDWSATSFGPLEAWPQSLRSAISICLNSPLISAVHWGPDLRILYNDAYVSALAERHPSALGKPFSIVWKEIWDVLGPQIQSVLATGQGFSIQHQLLKMYRRNRFEDTWWTYSFAPIRGEEGSIAGIFVTALDTSAQVIADNKLRESEERLQLALAAGNSIGTWDWDTINDRVTADIRFARLYGVDPERAASGAPVADFFHNVHYDDLEKLRDAIAVALKTGEIFSEEYRLVQPDETVRWVAAQGRCILAPDGTPVRFPGITFDITDRKRADEHRKILIDELNHRVKNTLAVVQSIASQTLNLSATMEEARSAFGARLVNLSQAHDVLTRENWTGADLNEIVADAIRLHSSKGRFNVEGPKLRLAPSAALAIQMALHELSTNAAKYGALSNEEGHVAVAWQLIEDKAKRELKLVWSETGGPPVTPPRRRGFGSRLVEHALAEQLGGHVSVSYEPSGVICTIKAPLRIGSDLLGEATDLLAVSIN